MRVSVVTVASTVVLLHCIPLEMPRVSLLSLLILIIFSLVGTWYYEPRIGLELCDNPRMASVNFRINEGRRKVGWIYVIRPVPWDRYYRMLNHNDSDLIGWDNIQAGAFWQVLYLNWWNDNIP